MLQFPEEVPVDSIQMLGNYIFKKNIPIADAACAAWNILGYGGGKALKKTDMTMQEDLPSEEKQKQYFDGQASAQGIADSIPPWVYKLAIDLLLNFLNRRVQ